MRLAVLSPFLDRRHGTERCIVEQLERWAAIPGLEIHLYSQSVEDLPAAVPFGSPSAPGRIFWHKVPRIPGPHLFAYLFWFAANTIQRAWDRRVRGLRFDLVYSPGINAFDADVLTVHIVFHEFYRRVAPQLSFRLASIASWPLFLHRRLYYRLILFLERRVYRGKGLRLIAVSGRVAAHLLRFFQRADVFVVPNAADTLQFSRENRLQHRASSRAALSLAPEELVLLLIGNDWKNKGLDALLAAMARCSDFPLRLLVVGTDDRRAYGARLSALSLKEKVLFLDPCTDVLRFYAAADAYAGPSLEDAFSLPILEAMACGLPVIASSRSGAGEIITNESDGLVLSDPEDVSELASLIRRLADDPAHRSRLGVAASQTAALYTWDRNASQTWNLLCEAAAAKKTP